jgi:hypothetical protein
MEVGGWLRAVVWGGGAVVVGGHMSMTTASNTFPQVNLTKSCHFLQQT